MRTNPLLEKEFRQRMRTMRTPVIITGYVLCMVILTFFLLYENVQGQLYLVQPTKSQQVFVILSLLQMVVVAFLTPAFAAGAVSGERERKTLAVLLTTPLSPIGILLGKILFERAVGAFGRCHPARVQLGVPVRRGRTTGVNCGLRLSIVHHCHDCDAVCVVLDDRLALDLEHGALLWHGFCDDGGVRCGGVWVEDDVSAKPH